MRHHTRNMFNHNSLAVTGLIMGIIAQMGDLAESAMKRAFNIKDVSQLLPGHGGFMDRIDSLCFAAPLFFHLCSFYFGTGVPAAAPTWILPWLGR